MFSLSNLIIYINVFLNYLLILFLFILIKFKIPISELFHFFEFNPKIHNPPISLIIYFDTTTKNITIAPINDSN